MYLFLEIHDCEGSSPALKTKSGDGASEVSGRSVDTVSRPGEFRPTVTGGNSLTCSLDSFARASGTVVAGAAALETISAAEVPGRASAGAAAAAD